MSEEDFDRLRRRAHPAIYFVVQFCGIQSPFSAFAAAIQPQRKAPRPAGAPISHRGPRSAFLSEDAPRGRPRSPALRGAKRRRRGIRGGARSPGPARPPPPGQQASGFKVKRGAALWLPGQRGGPGGRTDGPNERGDLDAWKLRLWRRRRKSEEEQIIRTVERRRGEQCSKPGQFPSLLLP